MGRSPTSPDPPASSVTRSPDVRRCGRAVVVNGRQSAEAVAGLARELTEQHGTECIGVFADQRDPETVKDTNRRIFTTYGRLDILVNNAGVLDDALLGMISDASIEVIGVDGSMAI